MRTADLSAWLAQPVDYAAGVALYEQLGGRSVYRQLFAAGETSYSRQVLVRELTKLAAALATMAPPVQVPMVPAPAPPKAAPAAPASLSESPQTHTDSPNLAPVRDQLRQLRDERSHLHAQLATVSLKVRGQHAFRILAIGDLVLQLQLVEAHVLAHGTLPAGPVALADIEDEGELRHRLSNLVANRSKVRKNPKRAAELPALEAAIELIRQKLTPP